MGFGKGKGFTSKIRVPMTEVVIRGGGGLAAKTEVVMTETVELAEGSYP